MGFRFFNPGCKPVELKRHKHDTTYQIWMTLILLLITAAINLKLGLNNLLCRWSKPKRRHQFTGALFTCGGKGLFTAIQCLFLIYKINFLTNTVGFLTYTVDFLTYTVDFLTGTIGFLTYTVNFLTGTIGFLTYTVNFLTVTVIC